jgi:PrtD family type I secretion system ABC transporter
MSPLRVQEVPACEMAAKPTSLLREALRACRAAFLGAAAFSLVINLLMLTTSIYMLQIVDRVFSSGSEATLLYLTLIAGGAVLLLALLDVARSRMLVLVSAWVEQRLAPPTLALMIDGARASEGAQGDALRDLSTLRTFLGGAGLLTLFDAPWVPMYLAVVYVFHPVLGHLALAGAVVLFSLAVLNDVATHRRLMEATLASRRAARSAAAAVRNAEAIEAMGLIGEVARRWAEDGRRALALQTQAASRSAVVMGASKFFRLLAQIAVLAAGAKLVLDQELTGGAMIAASIIMGRALAPVEQAIGGWKQAVQALEAKRRLEGFLSRPSRRPEGIALPAPTGRLTVENVFYGFVAGKPPVLKGVSFRLEAGEALGVIGPSAAGKSTLARLLIGIDRPASGSVRLDGAEIFDWPRASLGRHLGYLPQDVELFSGAAAENIARLGEPDAAAVVEAASLANCHDMILRLDQGYATELGEGGARLSGGQRQRIALARALYGRPRLVVLDEPNANLDGEGEAALNQAIAELKAQGTTLVVIGHRPSTFVAVDKLLVLVEGAVQHFGHRSEVLERITRRIVHPAPGGGIRVAPSPHAANPAQTVPAGQATAQ